MNERELLNNLSEFKKMQPRAEWVDFTRTHILGARPAPRPAWAGVVDVFRLATARPAFVMPVVAVLVLSGVLVQTSSDTLPGDALYPVRSALDRAQVSLLASSGSAVPELELAQMRLADLRRAAEENRVKNLSSSIREFEENVADASREIRELVENDPGRALQATRGVVELSKGKAEVERILGAKIGEDAQGELESAVQLLVERELADLEARSLTEEQEALVRDAQEAYDGGEYTNALELIWQASGGMN